MGQWLSIVKTDVFSLQISDLGSDRRSAVLVREVHSVKEKLKIWCPSSIQKHKENSKEFLELIKKSLSKGKHQAYYSCCFHMFNSQLEWSETTIHLSKPSSSEEVQSDDVPVRCSLVCKGRRQLVVRLFQLVVWNLPHFHAHICNHIPTRVQKFWKQKFHVILSMAAISKCWE